MTSTYRRYTLSSLNREVRTTRNSPRLQRTKRAEEPSFSRQTGQRTSPESDLLQYRLLWRNTRSGPPHAERKKPTQFLIKSNVIYNFESTNYKNKLLMRERLKLIGRVFRSSNVLNWHHLDVEVDQISLMHSVTERFLFAAAFKFECNLVLAHLPGQWKMSLD